LPKYDEICKHLSEISDDKLTGHQAKLRLTPRHRTSEFLVGKKLYYSDNTASEVYYEIYLLETMTDHMPFQLTPSIEFVSAILKVKGDGAMSVLDSRYKELDTSAYFEFNDKKLYLRINEDRMERQHYSCKLLQFGIFAIVVGVGALTLYTKMSGENSADSYPAP